jgi:Photosynthetic reaction centre cytochrome C subunit
MVHKKKIIVFVALSVFVLLGMAAVKPPSLKNGSSGQVQMERNLKVLPKDISDAKLDSIMETYNIALGVKCSFCHVPSFINKEVLDFASDKEPMKEEARKMMRMTIDINKKNFHYNKEDRPEYLHVVTCKTCHRGEPFPPED